ncbi:MAG TPA: hypothetical protein DDW52_05060 [Planctomycetaceae bacterium]|nr:hypothetical protein [Planctomycetaceae bacterium]
MSTVDRNVSTSGESAQFDCIQNAMLSCDTIPDGPSPGGSLQRETRPSKKRKRNPVVRFSLMLIRRSHLYFGLLLAPWALLYGITAYLFNHPTHFSASRNETLPATKDLDTWPTSTWDAEEMAKTILKELNGRFNSTGENPIELSAYPEPSFESAYISASFESNEENYFVSAPIDGSTGRIRIFPKRKREPEGDAAPFQVQPKSRAQTGSRGRSGRSSPPSKSSEASEKSELQDRGPSEQPLVLDDSLADSIKDSLIARLNQQYPNIELDASSLNLRSVPELRFHANCDGTEWISDYDALSGAVTTREAGTAVEPDWRRFLLRLHVAHGYPMDGGVRWFWAIIVDVMAAVMVFWGLSGIVMWWQIKSTRRWGSLAMAASLAMAVALGVGMFAMLHSV